MKYCGKCHEHVQCDQREHSRFILEVPLRIHCHAGDLIQGRTVDASESGISAMTPVEMIVDQAVELGFQLPCGPVSVQAVVKNKSAFRYGFEFLPEPDEREAISRGCRALVFGEGN
jgi:PilZ domain